MAKLAHVIVNESEREVLVAAPARKRKVK